MSVYVGVDVHRKRSQIAVVDEAGEVQLNRNVANGVEPILKMIAGLEAGTSVAFEAAYGWGGWSSYWRTTRSTRTWSTRHVPRPSPRRGRRTTRSTPASSPRLLRADLLPEAWIAPPATRQLRALLRHRAQLVGLRTLLRTRIHAVLADFGHDRPAGCWSGTGRKWLASLALPAVSRRVVDEDLALMDALEGPIGRLDAEIHERAKADSRVKVLTTLPGVGELTALVILAEVGDVRRFPSARKLASWAGLTPTVRGSDRTVRHGHISKQGSTWLRWILCEAAQTAKRHPEFAGTYAAIAHRRGKKIATTAIARKLLTRAYHLLTEAQADATTDSAPPRRARPARAGRAPTGGVTTPGRARISA